jgi:hypothetical protein
MTSTLHKNTISLGNFIEFYGGDERLGWLYQLDTINQNLDSIKANNARKIIISNVVHRFSSIVSGLWTVESGSPIEQVIYYFLQREREKLKAILGNHAIHPQYPIYRSDGDRNPCYFLDFLIRCCNRDVGYAIECDGHDWHEKTREQARRDRVIRFTGSEIMKDPSKCVDEIIEIISNKESEKQFNNSINIKGIPFNIIDD